METYAAALHALDTDDCDRLCALVDADPGLGLARDEAGLSLVLQACYRRKPAALAVLLAPGLELDLFAAAAVGDAARVCALLEADPALLDSRSPDGFTPLQLAAYLAREEVALALLRRSPDLEARAENPSGLRAIHAAAAGGSAAILAALLAAGADVDATQRGGFTALHAAAHSGREDLVRVLLEHGADTTLATDERKRAVDYAREHGAEEAAALLG